MKSTVLSVTIFLLRVMFLPPVPSTLFFFFFFFFLLLNFSLRGLVPLRSYELPSKTIPESSSQALVPVEDHIASIIHTCSHLVFLWKYPEIYLHCMHLFYSFMSGWPDMLQSIRSSFVMIMFLLECICSSVLCYLDVFQSVIVKTCPNEGSYCPVQDHRGSFSVCKIPFHFVLYNNLRECIGCCQ